MVQGGLKKVQGGLEPPLAPHFPRLCIGDYCLDQANSSYFSLNDSFGDDDNDAIIFI